MFKRLILLAVAGVMVASTALASVTTDVKKAVDEIIRIVSDKEMKKPSNVQKRRAAIKKHSAPSLTSRKWQSAHWESTGTSLRRKSAGSLLTFSQHCWRTHMPTRSNPTTMSGLCTFGSS